MALYKVTQRIRVGGCDGDEELKQSALVEAPEEASDDIVRKAGLEQISWEVDVGCKTTIVEMIQE